MKSPWSSLAVFARLVGGAAFVVSPAGAEAPVVVSVHAPEMDWPEARRNVEAELRASGFEVEARQSAVVDPGSLLAELPLYAAQEPRSVGSVTVVRVGSTGLAYVWVRDHERLFRVDVPSAEANVAAGMLALRVADLMTVRPGKRQEDSPPGGHPAAPRDSSAAVRDASPPPASAARGRGDGSASEAARPWVWLGAGAAFAVTSGAPGAQITLGAGFPLTGITSLELGGALSVTPASVGLPEGSVDVDHQQLGAHLMLRAGGGAHWSLTTGLGASAWCLQAQGTAQDDDVRGVRDTTCVGLASARARLTLRWRDVSLWAVAEPGLVVPTVRLRADRRTDVELGRPWFAATLGVGWQL